MNPLTTLNQSREMFDQAVVTKLNRETNDSVTVILSLSHSVADKYDYKQGQNLTLIREFDGTEVRRSYSICASVNDAELRVGIKKIPDGLFSSWANEELKVGDVVNLLPPAGHFFTELDANRQGNYLGVAAGSGITPVLSILKTTLETEPHSYFTLLYGNKRIDSIMFLEDIEALKNKYPERFRVFNILSQEIQNAELLNGRIDATKMDSFLNTLINAENLDEAFLCGPFEMVMSVQQTLLEHGMQQANVHTELFGTPSDLKAIESAQNERVLSKEELAHTSEVTVVIDGKGSKLHLKRGGDSILDAALKIRSDLPFACKGGVCATCKAKIIEGQVEMDVNYSLSPQEIEQGFVLSCQSHPISDKVIIDFDQK